MGKNVNNKKRNEGAEMVAAVLLKNQIRPRMSCEDES